MYKMLKCFICVMIVFTLLGGVSYAGTDVTLAWDANTEPDLKEYRLYEGIPSGKYNPIPVAITSAGTEEVTLRNLADGVRFWVVTAADVKDNESGYSNEVTADLDAPPDNPTGCYRKF